MTPITIQEITELLTTLNIPYTRTPPPSPPHTPTYYDRDIYFTISNTKYKITWFHNESTLYIGGEDTSPLIPFKYMELNTTFPTRHNHLKFSYRITGEGFLRGLAYDSFYIPLLKEEHQT